MTELSFDAPKRYAIVGVALLIFTLFAFQALKLWIARHLVDSDQIDNMQRGAALVPENAESWNRLGQRQEWDLAAADPTRAIQDFRKAVAVDPLAARYWVDLADALEISGDVPGAERAFERARSDYPSSADVAFSYGNFLLRQGQLPQGYAQLRAAAQEDPKLVPLILSRAYRATEDVKALLDDVLPRDANSYLQALAFFSNIHQGDAAIAAWSRVLALHQAVSLQRTFPLFEELISENRGDDAKTAWHEAVIASGMTYTGSPRGSLVWDGKFAEDFLDGGLGWRYEPQPNASIGFDSQAAPDGSRAVRLDFDGGANLVLATPSEYVPIAPSRRYHFHAYLRTDQITTESGVHFVISDASHGNAVNVVTEDFVGSHPWSPVEADFTSGSQTSFVKISLRRELSRLFENKLSGTVWIADVSIVPVNAAGDQTGK